MRPTELLDVVGRREICQVHQPYLISPAQGTELEAPHTPPQQRIRAAFVKEAGQELLHLVHVGACAHAVRLWVFTASGAHALLCHLLLRGVESVGVGLVLHEVAELHAHKTIHQ